MSIVELIMIYLCALFSFGLFAVGNNSKDGPYYFRVY